MRTVFTMAMKDLRLISRDWLGMFFIVGFPVLMGLFFGSMFGSIGDHDAKFTVAVVDEDDSTASRQFVKELTESKNIDVEKMQRTAAMDSVRRGQLVGMIALPKGFGESSGFIVGKAPKLELGVDPSRKAEGAMLQGIILQTIGKSMFGQFQDPAKVRTYIDQLRSDITNREKIPATVAPAVTQLTQSLDLLLAKWEEKIASDKKEGKKSDTGPEFQLAQVEKIDVAHKAEKGSRDDLLAHIRSKWDVSFPQAMMWGVLACAAGFAISVVRERKQGTLLRLQVAPVSRTQIVAGKALACFIAVIGVIALMTVWGMWLGMRPLSLAMVTLAAVSIAVCFVGIMVAMSVIGKSEEAVSGAAWSANMLMAMFGGGMVPLIFMPTFMRTLSSASPVKWSILALEGAIWRDFSLSEMLLPCGLLVAIGVAFFAIGSVVLSRATN
ncbi:MAG TPA: ABC transporter permease [Lacipirellulaceae bacterium]|nr:ABC transporter permease [Lacipirellulaceae bacterium]